MTRSYIQPSLLLLLIALTAQASEPVFRVIKSGGPGETLLRNGGFEQAQDGTSSPWRAYGSGFRIGPTEGRQGSGCAAVVENRNPDSSGGASQTLVLNRALPAALVVRGWSKAENVSGSPGSDYSLYVDLVYADGSTLWGQTANFRCGTHDWEARERVILPEKPVKSLTVYGLLRGHTGKVWFDDFSVEEFSASGSSVRYQGAPMELLPAPPPGNAPETKLATSDGLRLITRDDSVTSLQVDGRELAAATPGGFLARDVASNSDVFRFEGGACPELGLRLDATCTAKPGHLEVAGRVSDCTQQDRAITLLFALPLDATGWHWGKDIRHSQVIQGSGEFSSTVNVRCGATGTMSLYPLAALWNEQTGLAIGLDMGQPAQYRLFYHAGTKQLCIAYDFGLVKETARFPSGADFRFVIYRFDPAWGFRAAFQRFTEIFPDHFAVRARNQGMWMPFTDVSTVQGWEDFGFRFHEGNNNVPWDDEHGVLSFRYTEPMTWWMPMKPELARTPAEALRIRDDLTQAKNASTRRMAALTQSAAMFDEDGLPALLFRDTPWCNGAVWSLNPNPHLPGEFNGATVHWNDDLKTNLYGPASKGRLDGEYLDSLEGYVTADLNFRREHFHASSVPLSFASDSKRPALFKGLTVFEFTKWFCDDVHRLDKLTFANGVPYRFSFLAPWLDVLGTETDWLRAGSYRPAPEPTMNLWRTMACRKPYLLLMNTDYNALTPDLVERYFQRALFFGMFPGMFSHNASEAPYWRNPKWFNRDRHLFKQVQPLVKRIAEAGWQPVTRARSGNDQILLERFGPDPGGTVFFTLFNDTTAPQAGSVEIDTQLLGLSATPSAQELLSSQPVKVEGSRFAISLPPQTARLVRVNAMSMEP